MSTTIRPVFPPFPSLIENTSAIPSSVLMLEKPLPFNVLKSRDYHLVYLFPSIQNNIRFTI